MKEENWNVYILRCADGTFYTGITDNLPRRFTQHGTAKGAKYTRSRGPFELVYSQSGLSHSQALAREYAIKQMTRAQKLQLIRGAMMTPEE